MSTYLDPWTCEVFVTMEMINLRERAIGPAQPTHISVPFFIIIYQHTRYGKYYQVSCLDPTHLNLQHPFNLAFKTLLAVQWEASRLFVC